MARNMCTSGEEVRFCDICETTIKDGICIDGRTKMGPWADMCQGCHKTHGIGLGLGKGQKYQRSEDGKVWKKIAG